jgi:hypothetical protein
MKKFVLASVAIVVITLVSIGIFGTRSSDYTQAQFQKDVAKIEKTYEAKRKLTKDSVKRAELLADTFVKIEKLKAKRQKAKDAGKVNKTKASVKSKSKTKSPKLSQTIEDLIGFAMFWGVIIWLIVRAIKKRKLRKQLAIAYADALSGNDKAHALMVGRAYYAAHRRGNRLTLYDEAAIRNDIAAMNTDKN